MHFTDIIKQSVLEGFSYADISTTKIVVTLLIAYALALYVHAVYRFSTKNAFYYRNFGISLTLLSVITAGIILAIQSSLVISLGMVGALSIVRFRTAIKDPLDLLFLFWSISIGIICGAGLYELAILVSVMATVGIVLFEVFPLRSRTCMLVINAASHDCFHEIVQQVQALTAGCTVKSKNINHNGMELILEIRLRRQDESVVDALLKMEAIESVHLLENDNSVKS